MALCVLVLGYRWFIGIYSDNGDPKNGISNQHCSSLLLNAAALNHVQSTSHAPPATASVNQSTSQAPPVTASVNPRGYHLCWYESSFLALTSGHAVLLRPRPPSASLEWTDCSMVSPRRLPPGYDGFSASARPGGPHVFGGPHHLQNFSPPHSEGYIISQAYPQIRN